MQYPRMYSWHAFNTQANIIHQEAYIFNLISTKYLCLCLCLCWLVSEVKNVWGRLIEECDINKQTDGKMDRKRLMKTERPNQTDRFSQPLSFSVCFPFVPLLGHLWLPLHISLCSFLPRSYITLHQTAPLWSTVTHMASAHSLRTAGASSIFIQQHLHSLSDFWGNNL